MTVACTQLRQELKEVPRAQKWALAHAGVKQSSQNLLQAFSFKLDHITSISKNIPEISFRD